jgi:hypothetical protein
MAPSTAKSRQWTRLNISTKVHKIKAYESQIMTLKAANELDVLRGRLRKY